MSADRAARLSLYLEEVGQDERFWERSHCLLFLARWAALERPNFDLAPFLDRCTGPLSAARVARAEGGVDALVTRAAAGQGLGSIAVAGAATGDIGLIRMPRPSGKPGGWTLGCIRSGPFWAIRSGDGVALAGAATMRVQPHLAWKV